MVSLIYFLFYIQSHFYFLKLHSGNCGGFFLNGNRVPHISDYSSGNITHHLSGITSTTPIQPPRHCYFHCQVHGSKVRHTGHLTLSVTQELIINLFQTS